MEGMGFKKYTKIHRYGTSENEGLFDHEVTITEKVDGANTRVMKFEGKIYFGTHNQMLADDTANKSWGGFVEFVEETDWSALPEGHIIYGEWMKKHTIDYKLEKPCWVAFDLYDTVKEKYYDFTGLECIAILNKLSVISAKVLFKGKTTKDEAKKLIGKSFLNPEVDAEGICVKAYGQLNDYGRQLWGKFVRDEFKEANQKTFMKGGKPPIEVVVCDMYTNEARVMKSVQRLIEEGTYEKDMRDMRFLKDYVIDDILAEEETKIRDMIVANIMPRIKGKVRGTVVHLYKQMLEDSSLPSVERD